jgi:hypothetical protein
MNAPSPFRMTSKRISMVLTRINPKVIKTGNSKRKRGKKLKEKWQNPH